MSNIDQQILDASRTLRDAHAKRQAALDAVDTAKRRVQEREKEAADALTELQAAEKHLRAASMGESQSMTSRVREM